MLAHVAGFPVEEALPAAPALLAGMTVIAGRLRAIVRLDSGEMISAMRLTRMGKLLLGFLAATVVVSLVAPTVGLVMAIVLAVAGLFALAEGLGSTGAEAGHEAWANVEAERKREALHRRRV